MNRFSISKNPKHIIREERFGTIGVKVLNPDLIVDRNIETKFVRVADSNEPLDPL